MSKKFTVTLGMFIGSFMGGYVPTFFGIDAFSYTSAVIGAVGALLGVWIGFKIGDS